MLAASLTSCGSETAATDAGGKTIVCTTAMIGDIAREVAGDDVEVFVLFGPDVDPHLFRPTRDDVATLMRADVVLYNGFHLEGYLTDAIHRVAEGGVQVFAVAEQILDSHEIIRNANVPDPHVWMDPSLWLRSADLVAGIVGDLVPASRSDANARAADLAARLAAFDAECATRLARIPEERRILLTAHDAFSYFGRHYGVMVEGIQGVSTASEASLHSIEGLVDLIVERRLPAVFFESTVSERNVKALVEGARARGHLVAIGGVLHADAPGDATTYEGMLRHNIDTIVSTLSTATEVAARASGVEVER